MRALAILAVSSALMLHGQGSSVPTGGTTLTALSAAGGYPLTVVHYDKAVWVSSRNCMAFWGNYLTGGVTSEAQDALFCYSYAENRTHLLWQSGAFHSTHGPGTGHQWGTMFYDSARDAVVWIASSGSNTPGWDQELYQLDVASLTVSRIPIPTTSAALNRVWLDSNIVYKAATYDSYNQRAIFFPNYNAATGNASICNLSAMTCINSGTTNGAGVLDEQAMSFNADDHKVWVWDGSNLRSLDASGSGTWTAPTTTCTGTGCVGTHPGTRIYNGIAYSTTDHKFLMIGGITAAGGTAYDEIWTFDPVGLAWNQICSSSCGFTNNASGPLSQWNRLVYDPADNVFLYLQAARTVLAYAISAPLNYGRTSTTYAPSAGSLNRTAPPSSPSTSNAQTQAFDLSVSASGSTLYLARVETDVPTDSTSCAVPVPYVTTSAGTHLPSGTQASACAATGYNGGTYTTPASHPYAANVNGTLWMAVEQHGQSGLSANSAVYVGTYNGSSSWSLSALGVTTAGNTQYPAGLVAAGTTPTLAVIEQENSVFVREHSLNVYQYSGSWTRLGGARLNINGSGTSVQHASIAATAANNVAAIWAEEVNTNRITLGTTPQIYAKAWNGSAWSRLGTTSLNVTAAAYASAPSIISFGGTWYAAWTETAQSGLSKVYVKSYSAGSNAWSLVGSGALNINTSTGIAYHATLATDGTYLYLGWEEQTAWGALNKGYVKRWDGSNWGNYAGPISKSSASGSVADFSVAYAGSLQAAWTEITYGNLRQVYTQAVTPLNTFTMKNVGSTESNHPVQVGRAFVQGEIPNGSLPQAFVDGSAVNTQVDVKARWADNSLKHAVISFLIPAYTSGQTYTISLIAGTTVGNTSLTQAQMLGAGYDFDAVISMTKSGVTKTASARTMLTNGDYIVWASGPIATTILLGHHAQGFACVGGAASGSGSVASKYDFGFDSFCPIRPMFYATFWPTINKVKVRYIGELGNTEQLEDVTIDSMQLTIGSASPTTVYTRSTSMTMRAATRWTKEYWIGGAPAVDDYNPNLSYLSATKALPNYDTTKTVSGSAITSVYSSWTSATKDLYQYGIYDVASSGYGGGGGHIYVGPYPSYAAQWLYTGDHRLFEILKGQGELLAGIEFHFREGKSGKKLDQAGTVNGVGYPLSISTRPTVYLSTITASNTATADKVVPVGTASLSGSEWDGGVGMGNIISHFSNEWYPLYLTTGDYYFLEESQFWTAYTTAWPGADQATWRSRGPTGAEGGIPDKSGQILQERGQAWTFRNRVETAWITPDASPFKAYLEQLIADTIAYWEGQRNITTSSYHSNTMWNWGYSVAFPASGQGQWDAWECGGGIPCTRPQPPALHNWDIGSIGQCDHPEILGSNVQSCASPWQQEYILYVLGRGRELGYATTELLKWAAPQATSALTDGTYNPYLTGAYRMPSISNAGGVYSFYGSWAALKAAFDPVSVQGETDWYPGAIYAGQQYTADGEVQNIITGTSMVADQTNGAAAWTWVQANILPAVGDDPKWALLPRSIASSAPSCSISPSSAGPYTAGATSGFATFSASNCSASSWSATGLTGSGLSLNSSTGALAGTAVAGTYSVVVSYDTASVSFTLTINSGGGSAGGSKRGGRTTSGGRVNH